MSSQKRYAIITPYYKEDKSLIQRCMDSVRNQSVASEHFVIADGFPQSWIDREAVRHLKLDRGHGDYGNTPRGIGALIAIAEEYDGIGLLDADNWLESDHVEACIEAAATIDGGATQCDYVIAQRRLRRPDETIMALPEELGLVDTNCFFFLRGSFDIIPHWAMMPRGISAIGDRIFYAMVRRQPYRYARVEKPTVNYLCLWEICYRALGEDPPADAKPNIDSDKIYRWLGSLSPRELEIGSRLSGVQLIARLPPPLNFPTRVLDLAEYFSKRQMSVWIR
jgi:glycosyltransferase involved in cell wall biosynthesis